jgi:hypothetical protein
MLKRTYNLLSEEYAALIFLLNHIQEKTGSRPSQSQMVGKAITSFAAQLGHQADNKGIIKNGTATDN